MGEQTFEWSDTEMMDHTVAASGAVQEARVRRLEWISRVDTSRAYRYDGLTSVTSFLMVRCGMGAREAKREVFLARSWAGMGHAAKFVDAAELTLQQFEVLAYARKRHPDEYGEAEEALVEAVRGLSLDDTRRLVAYWSQSHDHAEGADSAPSEVSWSKTIWDRGVLDGDLDAELYALWDAALGPIVDELVNTTPKDDMPPMARLRAQALGELLRRHLDSAGAPTDHGNRPHITAIIDWDTLAGTRPGGLSELADGTIISPETARRLACDAIACRLITGPNSEILDLGRGRRTVSAGQWRALRVRDRHCQFPQCDRPWSWTDAHHLDHWADGGCTDLCRLVLLCRQHHVLVHEGGWKIRGSPGDLIFIRPDGTNLSRPPP